MTNKFKDLQKQIERTVLQDPFIQLVRKKLPYKIPKGFMNWKALSRQIAISLDMIATFGRFSLPCDEINSRYIYQTESWFRGKFPLYLLSLNLCRAFDQSQVLDKPNCLLHLTIPVEEFILLPPLGMIKTENSFFIDHIVVNAYKTDGISKRFKDSLGGFINYDEAGIKTMVAWSAVDNRGTVYSIARGLKSDGTFYEYNRQFIGSNSVLSKTDLVLVDRINNIVLQSILVQAYKPELIELETSRGFGGNPTVSRKNKGQPPLAIYPRWLGKNYQIKTHRQNFSSGTGTPKRTHWRSGHWREQPYGSRENPLYKQIFIEPILINPEY
jgi:hypothetical protein